MFQTLIGLAIPIILFFIVNGKRVFILIIIYLFYFISFFSPTRGHNHQYKTMYYNVVYFYYTLLSRPQGATGVIRSLLPCPPLSIMVSPIWGQRGSNLFNGPELDLSLILAAAGGYQLQSTPEPTLLSLKRCCLVCLYFSFYSIKLLVQ